MRKRKHRNGCLLRLLSLCASMGFLLLIGLFGLYYVSETPNVYSEQVSESILSTIYKESYVLETEEVANETEVESIQSQEIDGLQETNPVQDTLVNKSQAYQKATEDQKDMSKDTVSELEEIEEGKQETEVLSEALDKESVATNNDKAFEEVAVYDAYVLSLDENVVDKMGEIYKEGQIDYQHIVNQLFSNLSFSDQLRLLNIILSKVQTININEVWNMINDGIDEEESVKLQQLVQANFTIEELDELYMYYQSIELVENE